MHMPGASGATRWPRTGADHPPVEEHTLKLVTYDSGKGARLGAVAGAACLLIAVLHPDQRAARAGRIFSIVIGWLAVLSFIWIWARILTT